MTTEERLEKVEKELMRGRWFNRFLVAGLCLVIGTWVLWWAFGLGAATAQPAEAAAMNVIARQFTLVDEKSKTLALLSVLKDRPILCMSDENGRARVMLSVDKRGPWLFLYDRNGKNHATLGINEDGPSLFMLDENGKFLWKAP